MFPLLDEALLNEPALHKAKVFPAVVLLYAPRSTSGATFAAKAHATELQAHGFHVQQCADVPSLYTATQKELSQAAVVVVVLAAPHAEICTVSAHLRMLHPAVGILAVADSQTEITAIQLLQSGADAVVPMVASAPLMAAMLFRLLWRLDMSAALRSSAQSNPVWALSEQGWILSSPNSQRIPLTTGERAFLLALMTAPNQRASHAQLTEAVNEAYVGEASNAMQSRLSVLVSRLRRKCMEHGARLPVKSVHNWGYMFTGQL